MVYATTYVGMIVVLRESSDDSIMLGPTGVDSSARSTPKAEAARVNRAKGGRPKASGSANTVKSPPAAKSIHVARKTAAAGKRNATVH